MYGPPYSDFGSPFSCRPSIYLSNIDLLVGILSALTSVVAFDSVFAASTGATVTIAVFLYSNIN